MQCMCVNESFCVTGSDDGYVRVWPLDFKHVLLEAQHDGPVTAVDISVDCLRVIAATCTVSLSYSARKGAQHCYPLYHHQHHPVHL